MKTIKNLTIVVFGLIATSNSFAQNNTPPKFFTAIELGEAQHSIDVTGEGINFKPESGDAFSPSLAIGYNFTNNLSIIAQYTDYHEADLFDINSFVGGTPVNILFSTETSGFSLVGQYTTARHISDWSFGGKLGFMKWDTDLNIQYSGRFDTFTLTTSDSGIALYGGLIGSYAANEKWDITLAADWFANDLNFEIFEVENLKADMKYSRINIGLKYYWQ